MTNIITIAIIFSKYARSNPGFYFLGVVFFPLSLLVPLLLLSNNTYFIDIFIGSVICSTTIMTISDISDIISRDKYVNAISFFITRPIPHYQYVLGVGLSTLVYNLIGMTVIFICGIFFLNFSISIEHFLFVALCIFIGWLISSCVGFIIGMWGPKDPRMNTSIATMISYLVTFLAPIYYPIHVLPPVLQKISYFLYTTNLALIAKDIIRNQELSLFNFLIVAFYFLIAFILLLLTRQLKTIFMPHKRFFDVENIS